MNGTMKVNVYNVRFYIKDKENCADETVTCEVIGPDMPLEDAKKYMYLWALHEWPNSNLDIEIIHIDKKYLIGWV